MLDTVVAPTHVGHLDDAPYLEAFALLEHPFRLAPNPKFAFRTVSMGEALERGRTLIDARLGLGVISGEIGTGKTTLAGIFANEAERVGHAVAALPRVPGGQRQTAARLLNEICRDFGMPPHERQSADRAMQRIEAYAYKCQETGKRMAVMIDEAHLMRAPAIESVLGLLGICSDAEALIQVMLFGQEPEMMDVIKSNRALHSRIALHTRLELLEEEDLARMVVYRLGAAGRVKPLFSQEALGKLARAARGIPRIACTIANLACTIAFERRAKLVELPDVTLAAERLEHHEPAP